MTGARGGAAVLSDFGKGVATGLLLAALAVGYMAAGRLAHDPGKAVAAVVAAGVPIDPRVERTTPQVRRNLLCTALAVVMEARGEPDAGQIGVAWVVRTRAQERDADACAVVFAQAQFSWTAYPLRRIVSIAASNGEGLLEAQDYAWRVLVGGEPDPTRGANHFWSQANMPGRRAPPWARRALPGSRVAIGGHTFVRLPHQRTAWGAGR